VIVATRSKAKAKTKAKAKRPAHRPPGSTKATRAQIEGALIKSRGQVAIAAQLLGVTRQTVHNAIARWPELGETRDLYRAMLPEVAELTISKIASDPEHKDAYRAASFILSRLAPEVWAERHRVQITGADGGPVRHEVSLAAVAKLVTLPDEALLTVGAALLESDDE
jgi:hypothetical protein